MNRKFLILALLSISSVAFSQTAAEEALILNQELQFLEDSVSNIQSSNQNTTSAEKDRNRTLNEKSLERTYFDDTEEDSISTRTAGPKRRKN